MGRAFRYQRRLAHLSIVLAEKGANGKATVASDAAETATPAKTTKGRTAAKKSSKKTAAKKTAAKR
jgi:large subunit ribosomal protein L22